MARSIEDLRLCLSLTVGADPRQPDVPPVPLDTVESKHLSDLKIAWSDSWEKMPPAWEIKETINLAVNKLKPLCSNMEQWRSFPFDLHEAFQVCDRLTALNFVYSQPVGFDNAKKDFTRYVSRSNSGR